jgi:uncharacterized membrane protein
VSEGHAHAERLVSALTPHRAVMRLALALCAASVTVVLLARFNWMVRVVAGWNALAATELALSFWVIASSNAAETRARAESREPGRTAASFVVRVLSPACLFLSMYLLRHAGDIAVELRRPLVLLCLAAVVASWFLTHTAYAAHYARLYFRRGGGLGFPGDRPPDYWDFVYYSFTIGMCFQVSDVDVTEPCLRRATLGHAVLSFAYNTAILALALNLVAGL